MRNPRSTPDGGRSASPYIPSETGHISDEGKSNPKGKVSKAKRTGEFAVCLWLECSEM